MVAYEFRRSHNPEVSLPLFPIHPGISFNSGSAIIRTDTVKNLLAISGVLKEWNMFITNNKEDQEWLNAYMCSGLLGVLFLVSLWNYTAMAALSLRGPRGGRIFFKKELVLGVDLESAINNAVFPGLQGGPHNHTIAGLAVCLKLAQLPDFVAYEKQVLSNCKAFAGRLLELGYKLVSGGSDNYLVLVDLRPMGIKSVVVPGGIRIGTPAMTTRCFTEEDFVKAADLVHEGVGITLKAKKLVPSGSTKLKDYLELVQSLDFPLKSRTLDLRRVEVWMSQYPLPGV
ncbi:hypothetical protein AMTR_s00050p00205910 [Amborella trichopoda]|uniref:Serine hydroxymethyltransferase-like domain-containing protein n=1 Tax=Amborella trichopoda TaxID=13333 RepID=W1PXF5_AMBTC|nr:hypothetical protein AMTR_s00050p00205910 [Amborella trichopoda]